MVDVASSFAQDFTSLFSAHFSDFASTNSTLDCKPTYNKLTYILSHAYPHTYLVRSQRCHYVYINCKKKLGVSYSKAVVALEMDLAELETKLSAQPSLHPVAKLQFPKAKLEARVVNMRQWGVVDSSAAPTTDSATAVSARSLASDPIQKAGPGGVMSRSRRIGSINPVGRPVQRIDMRSRGGRPGVLAA